MLLTTDRNQTFEVNWAWAPINDDDDLMLELTCDDRLFSQIALDFEGLKHIHTSDKFEGERDYDGYDQIRSMIRTRKGEVRITMFKTSKE